MLAHLENDGIFAVETCVADLIGDALDGPDYVRVAIISSIGGNDTLLGGEGDDRLQGGPGNDILRGGKGDDWLEGQAGSDTLQVTDNETPTLTVDVAAASVAETAGAAARQVSRVRTEQ